METVTIYNKDGTTEVYTSVTTTSYSNDGKFVKFKGKKDGETTVKTHEINCDGIKRVARE